jgi:hypothetical protein
MYLDPAIIPSFPPYFAGTAVIGRSLAQTLTLPGQSSAGDPKASKGHARTWSGSPASTVRQAPPPANYLVIDARLFGFDDKRLRNMVISLKSLIPSERMPPGEANTPNRLPGSMLLVPGAMVLEALLLERSETKASSANALPPPLDSGASLFPSFEAGIDWRNLSNYVKTFGKLLNAFVPVLQRPSFTATTQAVKTSVEAEVMKGLQRQINKLKRTLGEVVASYFDRYGWLNGLWDESHLVDTVEEVARWGKLVRT